MKRWMCIKKHTVWDDGKGNFSISVEFNYEQSIPLPSAYKYYITAKSEGEAKKVAKKLMEQIIQVGADSVSKKTFSSTTILNTDVANKIWKHLEVTKINIDSPELTISWLAQFYN